MKVNVIRHIVQCLIVALFLSPLWAESLLKIVPGEWLFFGTLASSTILGRVVLVDPFVTLETIAASQQMPTPTMLMGVLTVLLFYGLVRGRVFCGWVCPVNLILELIEFMAHKVRALIHQKTGGGNDKSDPSSVSPWITKISRRTKILISVGVLALCAVCGIPVFELVSPVGAVFRGLVLGAYLGIWTLLAIVLLELFFPGRLWCRKLCPLGGFYQAIGRFGFFSVKAKSGCIACNACKQVCIADPSILDPIIMDADVVVRSGDCMLCGKCLNVCPKNLLKIKPCIPLRRSR